MNAAQRLEELEKAIAWLRDAAVGNGVLVEGRSDETALHELGVGGAIRVVNVRGSTEDLVDAMAEEALSVGWGAVVLLTDWDRTGGRLARRLHDGLVGRVPVDLEARRRLASACHCKCVEEVPAELAGLRAQVARRG